MLLLAGRLVVLCFFRNQKCGTKTLERFLLNLLILVFVKKFDTKNRLWSRAKTIFKSMVPELSGLLTY